MLNESKDFQQMNVDFQTTLKDFLDSSDGLRKNELGRVCKALAAYPLEDEIIELISKEEIEVYNLGVTLQSIKLNMMVESLKQDAIEDMKKQNRSTIPDNIDKPDYASEGENNE